MKVSELVFYRRFPADLYGITAEQALDLAADGELPAFHKIDTSVTIHAPSVTDADGKKYSGADLGKWHSVTVQIPRGLLFDLINDTLQSLADWEGKPTLLEVDRILAAELPEHKSYLLWPENAPIRLERDKIFFLLDDLKRCSVAREKPISSRHRRTLLTIIAALCKNAGIDYEARGAAKKISDLTEGIGAQVDDETIRKILADIPDAVETRYK